MVDGTHYPFALAYQWWLTCDAYFTNADLSSDLDERWLREIGKPYLVNRTIPNGREDTFIRMVKSSGQSAEMDLEQRAARLSLALSRNFDRQKVPASAASKVSWFAWPQGWTMYDSYAAKALIGKPTATGLARMEMFYAALAMRGWKDLLGGTRLALRPFAFDPRLAERTIDKFLFLHGMDEAALEPALAMIDGFVHALPAELRDDVIRAGEATGEELSSVKLLHRDTKTDRTALQDRVDRLRRFKNEIS